MTKTLDGTPAYWGSVGLSWNIICGVEYVNEFTNILENFNLKLNGFQYGFIIFD